MPRKKNYVADATINSPGTRTKQASAVRTATLVFSDILGESERTNLQKSVNLEEWIGRGVDAWVWATIDSTAALLRAGRSPATVASHCKSMRPFFTFLTERSQPLMAEPSALVPLHVTQYVEWLQSQASIHGWSTDTVRQRYHSLKSIVQSMCARGIVKDPSRHLFQERALPNGNNCERGFRAFSDTELQRLAKAVKADLTDLHHGRLVLLPSDAIANRFLIVAMRTGINPVPLLELQRDAMRPGLLPGTMILRTVKHRGHQIQERALVRGSKVEQPTIIPTDAVAVLERTLADTESFIAEAPLQLKNRVWLYRSQQSQEYGHVVCLSYSALHVSITRLVRRRTLLGDDGQPLQVNISRLRKSFAKRAFRLTGGDLVTTARLLGNSPHIADLNYLRADEQIIAEGAAFIGQELSVHLRGDGTASKVTRVQSAEKTPVGGCQDNLYGKHAPKDGSSYCDQFVMCLFCPSFAIVGEEEELWRLFSYQVFARHELERQEATLRAAPDNEVASRLIDLYRRAIPFIDQFTLQSFGERLTKRAREKAERTLHPFWKYQLERGRARSGSFPV